MAKRIISIHGSIVTGFADELKFEGLAVGEVKKQRVSRILPIHPVKRLFFRAIRLMANDESRIAAWTRSWDGPWQVQIDKKNYGCFNDRHEAIAFEKQKIAELGKL
jgi:hypothetical protein